MIPTSVIIEGQMMIKMTVRVPAPAQAMYLAWRNVSDTSLREGLLSSWWAPNRFRSLYEKKKNIYEVVNEHRVDLPVLSCKNELQ